MRHVRHDKMNHDKQPCTLGKQDWDLHVSHIYIYIYILAEDVQDGRHVQFVPESKQCLPHLSGKSASRVSHGCTL